MQEVFVEGDTMIGWPVVQTRSGTRTWRYAKDMKEAVHAFVSLLEQGGVSTEYGKSGWFFSVVERGLWGIEYWELGLRPVRDKDTRDELDKRMAEAYWVSGSFIDYIQGVHA